MRMDTELLHPETLKQNKTIIKNIQKMFIIILNIFSLKKNKLIFFYFNIKYSETEEQDN